MAFTLQVSHSDDNGEMLDEIDRRIMDEERRLQQANSPQQSGAGFWSDQTAYHVDAELERVAEQALRERRYDDDHIAIGAHQYEEGRIGTASDSVVPTQMLARSKQREEAKAIKRAAEQQAARVMQRQ